MTIIRCVLLLLALANALTSMWKVEPELPQVAAISLSVRFEARSVRGQDDRVRLLTAEEEEVTGAR